MKARLVVVLAVLLLCGAANALHKLRPPAGVPPDFTGAFGCALASHGYQLGVFAPSEPFTDGSTAWKLFFYNQEAGTGNWSTGAVCSPSSPSEGVPSSSAQCFVDYNSGSIVIGEPWAHNGAGRIVVSTLKTPSTCSPFSVLAVGNRTGDSLGSDVAVFLEWIVAVGRRFGAPYIQIFKHNGAGFVPHSVLDSSSFGPIDNVKLFGSWVDVKDNWLLVGCPVDSGDGSVLAFKYTAQTDQWAHFQTLRPIAATGVTSPSFGSIVAVRGPSLYVSTPGSSTAAGAVYVFKYGVRNEWQIERVIKSPTSMTADEFGRAIAANDNALAISQASTPGAEYSSVHVYRQCGEHKLRLHTVVRPDTEDELKHLWGQRLAWSVNTLAIASPGLVDIWSVPASAKCSGNTGAFPKASCCEEGKSVVASADGTVTVGPPTSKTPSFIDTPIIVAGDLVVKPKSVISLKYGNTITVDGSATLDGKLHIQVPRPSTPGSHSIAVDKLLSYSKRQGSFKEVEITFESGETKCDKLAAQPAYKAEHLSIMVTATIQKDCKSSSSSPVVLVYVTLGVLTLVVAVLLFAVWKFPRFRDMIASSSSNAHRSAYRHTRLRTDDPDDEGRQLEAFKRYSHDSDAPAGAQEDNSLGVAIDDDDYDEEEHE